MMDNKTKYTPRKAPEPVWFVDPSTGDVVTLDLASARFWDRK